MLQYNFNRVFKARGIEKPYRFLHHAGISSNLASKISKNEVHRLDLNIMERLCIILNCTSNDLLEWIPEENTNIPADHALRLLEKPEKEIDFTRKLNAIPLGKMTDISNLIDEYLKRTGQ
ncbi:MAG: helix-turn-helix transcriptional regulator [Bacteroidales bacterium]|nr:helix-turn-helix transcriptional regulator [Bacteroidales bacterium]